MFLCSFFFLLSNYIRDFPFIFLISISYDYTNVFCLIYSSLSYSIVFKYTPFCHRFISKYSFSRCLTKSTRISLFKVLFLMTYDYFPPKNHVVFLPKIWYSRIILHKRSLHVTRERNESCFSPSTASHSYFLHHWWSWYFNILHLGLSGRCFTLQGNPFCLYPTGRYLGTSTFYLFTDFTDSCSYYPWCFDICCRCLYLRSHHRDYLQLYRYCHWLCHYLLPGSSLRSTLCSVHGQQTHL